MEEGKEIEKSRGNHRGRGIEEEKRKPRRNGRREGERKGRRRKGGVRERGSPNG